MTKLKLFLKEDLPMVLIVLFLILAGYNLAIQNFYSGCVMTTTVITNEMRDVDKDVAERFCRVLQFHSFFKPFNLMDYAYDVQDFFKKD